MDFDKLKQLLNIIRISADKIEQMLGEVPLLDTKEVLKEMETTKKIVAETREVPRMPVAPYDFDVIAYNDKWPDAVPPYAISAESEAGHRKRAKGVLDTSDLTKIEGTFLDFGCGDGYITAEATKRGALKSYGYDPERKESWKGLESETTVFTDDVDVINGMKFDTIFLYDVIDHAESPTGVLEQVKNLLSPEGTLYVRCHPYTSKHAAHVYKKINKAYIHLFAAEEDLAKVEPLRMWKTNNPIETYKEWFSDFKVVREKLIRETLDDFFIRGDAKKRLGDLGFDSRKLQFLEIQFVDYILRHK